MSSNGKSSHVGLASEDSDPAAPTPKREPATRAVDDNNATANDPGHGTVSGFKPDWRFWLIYISLCLVTFASAVDNVSLLPSPTPQRRLFVLFPVFVKRHGKRHGCKREAGRFKVMRGIDYLVECCLLSALHLAKHLRPSNAECLPCNCCRPSSSPHCPPSLAPWAVAANMFGLQTRMSSRAPPSSHSVAS